MAVALETVVKQLEDSGIVAAGKLKDFIPPKATPKSTEELVAELVKQNHLTRFQAQHVAAGKTKSLILGGYTILDKIGAGGMGQVFKATHRRMERVVAIKMLPPAMTKDAAAAARFQREVVAAAKLNHTNIVTAYDADQANGVHFLVMEYVEGKDLSALVKKDGPFSVAKAVNYILQAARGLEFAHGEGVVHRDIKPANLLLDKKGVVKILDMGLARIDAGEGVAAQAELTGTGAIMGTVDYMAPEQGLSTKHADARADIYSLGCTLHFLLIGKATYGGETVAGKLLAHHHEPIPNLCRLRDEVPEPVQAVFNKMVAKRIEDRYQTMTGVVADLEGCQSSSSSLSSPSSQAFVPTASTDKESDLSIAFGHQRLRSLGEPPQEYVEPEKKPRRAKTAKTKTKSKAAGKSKLSRPALIGLVAAGVLGIGILLAVVIIKMRTQDGTLIVEVNQPGALVQVLDQEGKVEISQPGGLKPISISVVPGKHRLRVEKDGFVAIADNISIESGGKLDIKARLVPKAKQVAGQANQPWNTAAFQQWVKATQALPAEKQIEAVSKKLMELNPGFDGKVAGADAKASPKIENGVVTVFGFGTDNVNDVSPIRALAFLHALNCGGTSRERGRLSDLSPLNGLMLDWMYCAHNPISDLTPLRGMPLGTLSFHDTNVSDLSPLAGMPLKILFCNDTPVADLSPLAGMGLTEISFTPKGITNGLDVIRQMNSIKLIGRNSGNSWAPANFWNKYDAGEFGKPAAPAKLAYLDPAFQAWMKTVATMPAEKQIEAVSKKLMELNPGFDGKVTRLDGTRNPKVDDGAVIGLSFVTDTVSDISPVRALSGLKGLACNGSGTGKGRVTDLSPLKGMQLVDLSISGNQISDLSALRGTPLTTLFVNGNPVPDLSQLAGMPLTKLSFYNTPVADLSPLKGMPLTSLTCPTTPVSDLSPLEGMPLTHIEFTPRNISKGLDVVRRMSSLKTISSDGVKYAPAEFWKRYDAGEFGKPAAMKLAYLDPAFQQWVKATQALPAEQQIEAVSKKLMELNPGFDGKVTPTIERGVVTRISLNDKEVSDISPVRAFAGLKQLRCGSPNRNSKLSDLSPLRGLSLESFICSHNNVSDLSPLEGMPITELGFSGTKVSDLSPLRGMPLLYLNCQASPVTELSPIRGMRIGSLNCAGSQVTDLSPVAGMPLVSLLTVEPQKITKGIDILRQMKSLETIGIDGINKWPAPEFWKKYDAGEFGKPATPARLAYLDPAFQAWVKATQALPAEKQIEAVSKKLMELNPRFDGKLTGYDEKSTPKIENGVVTGLKFSGDTVEDISPVRALAGLMELYCSGTDGRGTIFDLSPLQGMRLATLDCSDNQITNLAPLRGMPLTSLVDCHCDLVDLSPLAGMPLRVLNVGGTLVSDLSPLRGMPLSILVIPTTQAADLSPLADTPLTTLRCYNNAQVTDQTILPLARVSTLRVLLVNGTSVTSAGVAALQKALPNCKIEWGDPAKAAPSPQPSPARGEGAKKKLAYLDPAFQAWVKATQALPAEKQIEAVSKKLMELNPGFDGKLTGYAEKNTPKIVNGVVIELGCFSDNVADISPVRALAGLKAIACSSLNYASKSKLSDLSPLQGIRLAYLYCVSTQISDLSPLAGMPLAELHCGYTLVSNLSPLRGMSLRTLDCSKSQVSDLAPLEGMPLSVLICANTKVSDLSPLRGMPLNVFSCSNTQVTDLSPLQGMKLTQFLFSPKSITKGIDGIRQMTTLKQIGLSSNPKEQFPPAEFWKKYDAGEFGKPAAPAKLAYLDPAFQAWVKATQALPAEKQIEAVSKKLMELNPEFDGKVTGGDGKGTPKIENGVITELGFYTDKVNDISPLRALTLNVLACGGSPTVRGKLSDLSPLQGMHLIHLTCGKTSVFDLLPLKDMRLTVLKCYDTQVTDLAPLERMKLTYLDCRSTSVSDLSPLADCKGLTSLHIDNTKVTAAGVAALQKALPNCKIEWDAPAKLAYLDPAFQAWVKATQALPAEKQIEAVSKKLMELNPGFDGRLTNIHESGPPNVELGVGTELRFHSLHVTDISPLRAFSKLNSLLCYPGGNAASQLSDLSPLEGAPLAELRVSGTSVSDLSPLKGMPLTTVQCDHTHVCDLSPLEDCKSLTSLNVAGTKVTPASVAALQKALPNCKIVWDDPAKPKTP